MQNTNAQNLARALGWFSLVLGAVELIAPGSIKRQVGMPGPKLVLQAYGLREIGTGLAILNSDRPVGMVWGRVAGDVLDLATTAPVLRPSNPRQGAGAASFAFLLLATAIDFAVAMQGDEISPSQRRISRSTAPQGSDDATGLPQLTPSTPIANLGA